MDIELNGQRILDEGHLGLLPFAPLMKRPAGVAAETWLRQCVNRAQQVPMDEPLKANYLADLAILSGLVYKLETIMAIIAEETMYESSVVQYFTEKGIEQGIEQGGPRISPRRVGPSLSAGGCATVDQPH